MIVHGPDGTPISFDDLPKEKFPVSLTAFGPDGELVFGPLTIEPYVMTKIPGFGPGTVRYIVTFYGDGTASLYDDPTCGGTVHE